MTTEAHSITVGGIVVDVIRKDIKNLHLGVYPPNGRVRVATPLLVDDEAVRLAVIEKLGWIKRQQTKFAEQPRQSSREMVSGESHYYLGRRYRLSVHEHDDPPSVDLRGITNLELFIRPGTDREEREAILSRWYRKQLHELIQPLLTKWQTILSVQVEDWGIKKMKTKWGSCNMSSRFVWFNLELIKKPPQCIEYIVVHELVHLLEAHHDERFTMKMNTHFPSWQHFRDMLNTAPLGHEYWSDNDQIDVSLADGNLFLPG